jgi:hypothetical protein
MSHNVQEVRGRKAGKTLAFPPPDVFMHRIGFNAAAKETGNGSK